MSDMVVSICEEMAANHNDRPWRDQTPEFQRSCMVDLRSMLGVLLQIQTENSVLRRIMEDMRDDIDKRWSA